MVNSKQFTNQLKSTPKMSLGLRLLMQNTTTISVQGNDNKDELFSSI